MINLSKDNCTGCGACNNICPNNSITMIPDNEGFLYPVADEEKCIKCGLCTKVCPIITKQDCANLLEPKVYASWSLDDKTRAESSSGGIFTELAESVLNQHGYVAGAMYNKLHLVEHFIINNEENLCLLRQSKYTQSQTNLIFRDIKNLLDENNIVMFVGTPCQVAGLVSFLNKSYENLLLCDLVCHGVNSPLVYLNYLKELEIKYNSKVKSINFRDKTNGWKNFGIRIVFENNEEYYKNQREDLFYRGFIKNFYLRPSCYNCNFKKFPRFSDITLADFWGIKESNEIYDIDKGTSLIMINSQKGQRYFENLDNRIFMKENDISVALEGNPCIIKSSSIEMHKREDFFNKIFSGQSISNAIKELI